MPDEKTYQEPQITLSRIYTRTGDEGTTALVGGQRLRKDSIRIESYGTVDELNAFTGLARVTAEGLNPLISLAAILKRVQHELFNLGSVLATAPEDLHPRQPQVTAAEIEQLEQEIDDCNARLSILHSFVLPGASRMSAELHVCRTVCRRAERLCVGLAAEDPTQRIAVIYLNRLSDAFFVWSRWADLCLDVPETLWDPNQTAKL